MERPLIQKKSLMEQETRIASALITIDKNSNEIQNVNNILGNFSSEIIARQGLSLPSKDYNIISVIIESDINTINSFAGKVGKVSSVNIKMLIQK